jgi:hypothetical protein
MKSKLAGTLVALTVILGIGCVHDVEGTGGMGGHCDIMGGEGTVMGSGTTAEDTGSMSGFQVGMRQQGINQESGRPSEQRQG